MFRFPSVICTRCTGFFCLTIIKGPPNDIYCIIEEPSKHYFTEKVSYSRYEQVTKRIANIRFSFTDCSTVLRKICFLQLSLHRADFLCHFCIFPFHFCIVFMKTCSFCFSSSCASYLDNKELSSLSHTE